MSSAGVLVALGAASFEPAVIAALPRDAVHVVRRCVDVADLLAVAASRQGVVALVSAQLSGLDTDVVHRLARDGVTVVGVAAEAGGADEAVLQRLGVDRVAAAHDVTTLVELVREASSGPAAPPANTGLEPTQNGADRGVDPGLVIAVWGPTGAPGRSTVALGLGSALAELGLSALVIDADVYGGTLAQAVGMLDEGSGLLAATRAANVGALDTETLAGHCRALQSRLRVLTGLPRADRWIEAGAGLVRDVVETARRLADVTVVDCGFSLELDEELSYDTTAPRRNGATVEIIGQADTVIVVGAADPVGLGRLIRGVHELSTVASSARPLVVVNRLRGVGGWPRADLEAILRRTTSVAEFAWLPLDVVACDKALIQGKTLHEAAPTSKLCASLTELAAALSGARPGRRRRVRLRGSG